MKEQKNDTGRGYMVDRGWMWDREVHRLLEGSRSHTGCAWPARKLPVFRREIGVCLGDIRRAVAIDHGLHAAALVEIIAKDEAIVLVRNPRHRG